MVFANNISGCFSQFLLIKVGVYLSNYDYKAACWLNLIYYRWRNIGHASNKLAHALQTL